MSYATPREMRFHRWCHRMDWQPTYANYSRWVGMGEPAPREDIYEGTKLDQMVKQQLGLFEAAS